MILTKCFFVNRPILDILNKAIREYCSCVQIQLKYSLNMITFVEGKYETLTSTYQHQK